MRLDLLPLSLVEFLRRIYSHQYCIWNRREGGFARALTIHIHIQQNTWNVYKNQLAECKNETKQLQSANRPMKVNERDEILENQKKKRFRTPFLMLLPKFFFYVLQSTKTQFSVYSYILRWIQVLEVVLVYCCSTIEMIKFFCALNIWILNLMT